MAADGDKRVKLQVEAPEGEAMETETSRRKMSRFTMPDVPRWWQAKVIIYAFAHPHVRARMEKLMGSNLVRLTEKSYMDELEERIRDVNIENLNKRIAERVLNEMERLKRLILIGKTPLKECPPELFHHPVFVFWRMVNREVAKASKKREEAYLKKLKSSHKTDVVIEEESEEVEEEEAEQLTPAEVMSRAREMIDLQKEEDIQNGLRFTDEDYELYKYETQDVRAMRTVTFERRMQFLQSNLTQQASSTKSNLQTVEELYMMADRMLGSGKRL